MKYTKEFKLECIRKRKEGIYIETPLGIKRNVFLGQVRRWEITFRSLGEVGLEHGKPTLDIDQRQELIQRVENGESYSHAARSAGIGHDLLIKWHRIYLESGIDGLKSIKRGRPSMKKKPDSVKKEDSEKTAKELLEELEYLRAENEYLKKLNALVQDREARQQKKK
jgi:transposase-like protein